MSGIVFVSSGSAGDSCCSGCLTPCPLPRGKWWSERNNLCFGELNGCWLSERPSLALSSPPDAITFDVSCYVECGLFSAAALCKAMVPAVSTWRCVMVIHTGSSLFFFSCFLLHLRVRRSLSSMSLWRWAHPTLSSGAHWHRVELWARVIKPSSHSSFFQVFLSHGQGGDAFARIWVLLAVATAPKPESYPRASMPQPVFLLPVLSASLSYSITTRFCK